MCGSVCTGLYLRVCMRGWARRLLAPAEPLSRAERRADARPSISALQPGRLFFFHGGTHDPTGDMSGNSRQILDRLEQEWNDPEFVVRAWVSCGCSVGVAW